MQMFLLSSEYRDFTVFYILTQVIYPLSVARIYLLEICLQLRYAWTEMLSSQSDVRYVTLHVTEKYQEYSYIPVFSD